MATKTPQPMENEMKETDTATETIKLNKISWEAAMKKFPYTDEGNLEDDIDNSKRLLYQKGFIEGYTTLRKRVEELEGEKAEQNEAIRERMKEIEYNIETFTKMDVSDLKNLHNAFSNILND